MQQKIFIINGVNLNFIGIRETHLYGKKNFDTHLKDLYKIYPELQYYQSNKEGEIVEYIQQAHIQKAAGIILNPGAYTHTSLAIADAVASVTIPCVEVHLTNILARENYRHTSLTASHCIGVITGFGLYSYNLALQFLLQFMRER